MEMFRLKKDLSNLINLAIENKKQLDVFNLNHKRLFDAIYSLCDNYIIIDKQN